MKYFTKWLPDSKSRNVDAYVFIHSRPIGPEEEAAGFELLKSGNQLNVVHEKEMPPMVFLDSTLNTKEIKREIKTESLERVRRNAQITIDLMRGSKDLPGPR
jgi:hypothetical protein